LKGEIIFHFVATPVKEPLLIFVLTVPERWKKEAQRSIHSKEHKRVIKPCCADTRSAGLSFGTFTNQR
jgi:hypothetical protein